VKPQLEDSPPKHFSFYNEVLDVTDYCQSRKKELIIGCDANAHHSLWGALAPFQVEKASWNFL
jgi:hypothetical protein